MRAFVKQLLLNSFLLMALASGFSQKPLTAQLTKNDQQILDWYDGLKLQDFSMQPLVKVDTGWWSQSGNELAKNRSIHAFLVDESGDEFSVMTLGLEKRTFKRTADNTPAYGKVDFQKADLAEFAGQSATRIANEGPFERVWSGSMVSPAVELLVLARACVAQSLAEVAHDLLEESERLIDRSRDVSASESNFQQKLAEDLAHYKTWTTVLKLDDAEIPWAEIKGDFAWIQKHFPDTTHTQRCKDSAEMLADMIAKNKTHQAPDDFNSLSVPEQVTELIFQLQNQDGVQLTQPGSCDIFFTDKIGGWKAESSGPDTGQIPQSPARQLVDLGHLAVPQLIEALGDRRFTRSVGYHRNFYFSHHVLRVGDCSRIILEQIANRKFRARGGLAKQQVIDWWAAVESKGEKAVLIEAVEAGDHNSVYQAAQLIEKYPDIALPSIIKCAKKTDSQYVRSQMVEFAGKFNDHARDFIINELKTADGIFIKFAAGKALLKTDQRQLVVDYFIENWPALLKKNWITPEPMGVMVMGPEQMIEFVAGLNDPVAINSFRDSFPKMKVRVRMAMTTVFYPKHRGGFYSGGGIASLPDVEFSGDSEKAIKELLLQAMGDEQRNFEANGTWGDTEYHSPRICDLAGYVLAARYPGKYEFDFAAPRIVREQQRIAIINQWRAHNQIELLPLPKPRTVTKFDADNLKTIVGSIGNANTGAKVSELIDQLKSFGPIAFPTLQKAVQELPQEHLARERLAKLVQQLPNQISLIEISSTSAPLNDRWKQRIESLNQSTLSADVLIELVQQMAKQQPEGVSGISIVCERFKQEQGFGILIELTNQFHSRGGTQQMWNGSGYVAINGKRVHSSGLGFSLDYATTGEAYAELHEKLQNALEGSPNDRIEFRISLVKDK